LSEQMSLFNVVETQYGKQVDPALLCRPSDPETSQISAKATAAILTHKQAEFFAALQSLGKGTAAEVAAQAVPLEVGQIVSVMCKRETIRKRASELVKAGLVRVVGAKVCSVTNNMASVYEGVKAE
jgi:hypothetical protein